MAKARFNYYLHDGYTGSERCDHIEEQTGVPIGEELARRIGEPFYEVRLECELDTETGAVTVLTFAGRPVG